MGRIVIGIYSITSPSGRVYIGQSTNIYERWFSHRKRSAKNSCPVIFKSILKYGYEKHSFEILQEFPSDVPKYVLDNYEVFYINQYKSAGISLLNIKGGGSYGKHSEETKNKIRLANKGKQYSLGTKRPQYAIQATADKNRGRKRTAEQINRIVTNKTIPSNIGSWNTGKIRTEENKEKISKTLKNRTDNKGEFHNMVKLKKEQVLEIRNKFIPRIYTSRKLAAEYGISKTNVLDIVHNRIWNNL